MRHVDQSMCSRLFGNSSELSRVDFFFSTMWSSASLDKIGVREMGRRCLLISLIGLCFTTGTTSAPFQDGGRRVSWNEEMRMSETGPAKRSAFSFNNHIRMPSGPSVLEELSSDSFVKVENSDIVFTACLSLLFCGGSKGFWVSGSKLCTVVRIDIIRQVAWCKT